VVGAGVVPDVSLATRAGLDLPPRSCWLLYRMAENPACTVEDLAQRLNVDPSVIQPGLDGLVSAGMVDQRLQDGEHEFHLTASGSDALSRLTEARRAGLTDLLEGWNPEEHPEVIEMVKQLAHALLADDERLVADAIPHGVATAGAAGGS